MDEMEESYFVRLKRLLKDQGKSVSALLKAADLPETQYHSLVRYDNYPRADMAVKIAQFLDTSVEYMVTGRGKEPFPPDIMVQVRQLLKLDKTRRTPILANISSQVEFWKGASPDIIPEVEDKASEEDEELLELYHNLDERDKRAVMAMITALGSTNLMSVD
ncbi:MAG: helix-turn-helix domain-containing protein [Lachnospiraceae bacterium]|nr:helix-turn-helix domain-containing protein [Lachnospiraceae bacterium]